MALDAASCRAFVLSRPRPAMLATVRPDGSPHVAPVWVDVDGPDLVFNTGSATVKGRNLTADPAARSRCRTTGRRTPSSPR